MIGWTNPQLLFDAVPHTVYLLPFAFLAGFAAPEGISGAALYGIGAGMVQHSVPGKSDPMQEAFRAGTTCTGIFGLAAVVGNLVGTAYRGTVFDTLM